MTNTKDLRNELVKVFISVKGKHMKVVDAKTLIGAANAILKSCQLELEQNKMAGNKKLVDFLDVKK